MKRKIIKRKKDKDNDFKNTNNTNIPSKGTYAIIYRIINIVSDLIDFFY